MVRRIVCMFGHEHICVRFFMCNVYDSRQSIWRVLIVPIPDVSDECNFVDDDCNCDQWKEFLHSAAGVDPCNERVWSTSKI